MRSNLRVWDGGRRSEGGNVERVGRNEGWLRIARVSARRRWQIEAMTDADKILVAQIRYWCVWALHCLFRVQRHSAPYTTATKFWTWNLNFGVFRRSLEWQGHSLWHDIIQVLFRVTSSWLFLTNDYICSPWRKRQVPHSLNFLVPSHNSWVSVDLTCGLVDIDHIVVKIWLPHEPNPYTKFKWASDDTTYTPMTWPPLCQQSHACGIQIRKKEKTAEYVTLKRTCIMSYHNGCPCHSRDPQKTPK